MAREGLPRPGQGATPSQGQPDSPEPAAAPAAARPPARTGLPTAATSQPAASATSAPPPSTPAAPPKKTRFPLPEGRVARAAVIGVALVVLAAIVVLIARWLVSTEPVSDFIATYPGESHLPEGSPVGIPTWLAWQHFFNAFFLVLIVKTGWQVRTQKRPPASWTPRWSPGGRKISLTLWLHQSLDLLWVTNGVIFVILLIVSGHWVRIVPTSWDVFPHAISAALQYASLNWPTENGWVNYNALQLLAYFATVFIAAPLAIVTGVRMSQLWPARAKTLTRLYPIEVARALHLPVMFYFVAFTVVHVALVLSTGALRNLNHMYGGQDAVNWVGFIIFVVSLLVIVGGWFAARPIIVVPIASLFGKVART